MKIMRASAMLAMLAITGLASGCGKKDEPATPAKTEPAATEPGKTDPAKTDPAKEPAKTEPVAEPTKAPEAKPSRTRAVAPGHLMAWPPQPAVSNH